MFQVRSFLPEDAANYIAWLKDAQKVTSVDYEVYGYPALITLVVQNDGTPVIMISFHPVLSIDEQFRTQTVLMFETLAIRPGADKKDIMDSLCELASGVRNICLNLGYKEIRFQSSAPSFQKMMQYNGFEQLSPMMKRKVNFPDQPIREVWHAVQNDEHQKFLEQQDFKLAEMPIYRGLVHA